MQKKLLAAAVAGALIAPAAFAQSTVTISGLFKPSWARVGISGVALAGHTSETQLRDNSSRIIFNVVEDLGGGLSAVAQLDNRFSVDLGAFAASGNVWAGLASKSWGQLTAGRHDLHYTAGAGGTHAKGDLALFNTTLLHVIPTGTATSAGNIAVGNNTRTANSFEYKSPKWGMFSLIGAYSTSGTTAAEADLGSATRKGNMWHIRPQIGMDNWSAEWSHWDQKPDAQPGGIDKIKGDTIAGKITFGAFGIGLAYDRSRVTAAAGGGSVKRTAWSLPLSWTSGPHGVTFDWTRARDTDATAADDGARLWSIAYAYNLSKRTAVALSYGKLDNKDGGTYQLFTAPAGAVGAGTDQSILSVVFNHTF